MTLDKAEIAKLKVAELKAELESRSIEVPKGNISVLKVFKITNDWVSGYIIFQYN